MTTAPLDNMPSTRLILKMQEKFCTEGQIYIKMLKYFSVEGQSSVRCFSPKIKTRYERKISGLKEKIY